jgi:hypothetical protein
MKTFRNIITPLLHPDSVNNKLSEGVGSLEQAITKRRITKDSIINAEEEPYIRLWEETETLKS